MPNIYTKTGDQGKTALLGGKRISKASIAISAIGSVDELNAAIGLFSTHVNEQKYTDIFAKLQGIQHVLFRIGGQLASVRTTRVDVPKVEESHVKELESWIDEMEKILEPLTQFILPGGHPLAAESFLVRAVCRRAEREVIILGSSSTIDLLVFAFLNRLSDTLFVLGRFLNKESEESEIVWKK